MNSLPRKPLQDLTINKKNLSTTNKSNSSKQNIEKKAKKCEAKDRIDYRALLESEDDSFLSQDSNKTKLIRKSLDFNSTQCSNELNKQNSKRKSISSFTKDTFEINLKNSKRKSLNSNSNTKLELKDIQNIIQSSLNKEELIEAVESLCKIIAIENNILIIDQVINANLVKYLVSFLKSSNAKLQSEATWCLANITSGNLKHLEHLIDLGAIDYLIKLICSPFLIVSVPAVCALGNIAVENEKFRDLLINKGVLDLFRDLIKEDTNDILLENISWLISNLCRFNKSLRTLEKLISHLGNLIKLNFRKVLSNTFQALCNITTDSSINVISLVIKAGIVHRLVELLHILNKDEIEILVLVIRVIGNLSNGLDQYSQELIYESGLLVFNKFLEHDQIVVQTEAACTLSNLLSFDDSVLSEEILNRLFQSLCKTIYSQDTKLIYFTCQAICYMLVSSNKMIDVVIQAGIVERLIELLNKKENEILIPVLKCLGNITSGSDEQTQIIIDLNGLPLLKNIFSSNNPEILKDIVLILSNITACNEIQIQAVIDSGFLDLLANELSNGELSIKKEIAFTIKNFTANSSEIQLLELIRSGVIKVACGLLNDSDSEMVQCLWKTIEEIINVIPYGIEFNLIKYYLRKIGLDLE